MTTTHRQQVPLCYSLSLCIQRSTSNPIASFHAQRVSSHSQLTLAHSVRHRVFVDELSLPSTTVFDNQDTFPIPDNILHFLLCNDDTPIGTARVQRVRNGYKVEHMGVIPDARGKGAGKVLLNTIEQDKEIRLSKGVLFCHAKMEKYRFYQHCGWIVEQGHTNMQHEGIDHVVMVKRRPPFGKEDRKISLSHVMVRTKDIDKAIAFYSLFGFKETVKFTTDALKCAWIESSYIDHRIELIDISSLLSTSYKLKQPSLSDITPGLGHLSIDITRACTSINRFLDTIQKESLQRFKLGLKVLQKPTQMMIGDIVVEMAFVTDPDGSIIELIRFLAKVEDRKEFNWQW